MRSSFRDRGDRARFEERLCQGARALREEAPPGLSGRVLACLSSTARARSERGRRHGHGWAFLAAAALAGILGAWIWMESDGKDAELPARAPTNVVFLSRELLGSGTRVLDLPRTIEGNLRSEARNLLLDTTRAAEGLVRGLPAPLREPLQRL